MSLRRTLKGVTLIEMLLSLVIASLILSYFISQQLQSLHQQLVDKTVAQMNFLALSARNYYLNQQALYPSSSNISHWPQTLKALSDAGSIPADALCSSWPASSNASTNVASNKNADCLNNQKQIAHQEYAIFPANSSGSYNTALNGIQAHPWTASQQFTSSGGNFWGISLELPTLQAAREIQKRLPFATLCSPSNLSAQLTNNAPCIESNTVTMLVPRPAKWFNSTQYAKDGLIQSMGTAAVCGDPNHGCNTNGNKPYATIFKPMSCGTNPSGQSLTPVLFVYPFDYELCLDNKSTTCSAQTAFAGMNLGVKDVGNAWQVYGGELDNNGNMTSNHFFTIAVAYFTVCEPYGNNTWDITTAPTSYRGGNLQ